MADASNSMNGDFMSFSYHATSQNFKTVRKISLSSTQFKVEK
ncbi:hypothetical protein CCACVL1_12822 [Corchorus capsularis]|uniref:Uncharacterized protein n=1 Tax=Corchorus capsularis TaxID=210143 RepID=A0A1R3IDK0_COCAP|nr:hypothetical protein CCACVL1_12822 [Corchorus capsularis]